MKKQDYQKRSLAISYMARLLETYPKIPISKLLAQLFSPIGETKHPSKWTDNELIGKIETFSKQIEEDYHEDWTEDEYEN